MSPRIFTRRPFRMLSPKGEVVHYHTTTRLEVHNEEFSYPQWPKYHQVPAITAADNSFRGNGLKYRNTRAQMSA